MTFIELTMIALMLGAFISKASLFLNEDQIKQKE